jgi:glycerol-3-phosphate dehydrogenase
MPIEADVLIIGGGIAGISVARELSKYELDVVLVEKEADVGWGQTKASYAICHPGVRWAPGTLAQALIARSNQILAQLVDDLDIDFTRSGELVLAFNDDEKAAIKAMKEQGEHISIDGLEILSGDEIRRLEPSTNPSAVAALYLPTAGFFNPFDMVFAFCENARENGVKIFTETGVTGIAPERGGFIIETDQGEIRATRVINAAGLHAEVIASMVGADNFRVSYATKATCFILDKTLANRFQRIITGIADLKSFAKFKLLMPTYGGNLLMYTPLSLPAGGIDDRALEEGALEMTVKSVRVLVPDLDFERNVITAFSGLTARNDRNDFIIEASAKYPTFVNVVLTPPGITCSPIIGIRVAEILKENGLELHKKKDFNPCRRRIQPPRDLSETRIRELLEQDPGFGRVVCRCEKVTEGEIVKAVHRGASTLDGLKFRTRAGMGRCQGNYCTPRVSRILAGELNQPMEDMTKRGPGSNLLLKEASN